MPNKEGMSFITTVASKATVPYLVDIKIGQQYIGGVELCSFQQSSFVNPQETLQSKETCLFASIKFYSAEFSAQVPTYYQLSQSSVHKNDIFMRHVAKVS